MAFELKNGQGSMFENLKKTADNQPDFRGEFKDLSGHIFAIAGWKKKTKDGSKKFISLTIQEPRPQAGKPAPQNDSW